VESALSSVAGRTAPTLLTACHSEERSDEESALSSVTGRTLKLIS